MSKKRCQVVALGLQNSSEIAGQELRLNNWQYHEECAKPLSNNHHIVLEFGRHLGSVAWGRCLPNCRKIEKVWTRISWLRDFTKSCSKTSYRLVNRSPGFFDIQQPLFLDITCKKKRKRFCVWWKTDVRTYVHTILIIIKPILAE